MNHTKLKLSAVAMSLALAISACSGESPEQKTQSVDVEPKKEMKTSKDVTEQGIQKTARRIGESVANWQIAQFGNLNYIPESHRAKSENAKFQKMFKNLERM